jgi:hypothetical protein
MVKNFLTGPTKSAVTLGGKKLNEEKQNIE